VAWHGLERWGGHGVARLGKEWQGAAGHGG